MSDEHALQILIVDDQHAMRDALEMLFEAHGLLIQEWERVRTDWLTIRQGAASGPYEPAA